VCKSVAKLLAKTQPEVQVPALRVLGNIITGTNEQTDYVLSLGILPYVKLFLESDHKGLRKEACWAISNITAGTNSQIQKVIDCEIFPILIRLLDYPAEFEVQKEIAWAISNASSGGTSEQIKYLVSQGCLKSLCDMLRCSDIRLVMAILDCIENILRHGKNDNANPYAYFLDACKGWDKLDNLLSYSSNIEINQKISKIKDTYWKDDSSDILMENQGNQYYYPMHKNFNF